MLKLIKVSFLSFLLICLQTQSNATVAYLNLDTLISKSNIGKTALEKINNLDKQNIDNLKKKNKVLKDLESEIKAKKNIVSEEVFRKEINELKIKINEFTKDKNQIVKNFNEFKEKELDNIFNKITPIIKTYMDDNSITVLLDTKNIFMGKIEADLTEEILTLINKELD